MGGLHVGGLHVGALPPSGCLVPVFSAWSVSQDARKRLKAKKHFNFNLSSQGAACGALFFSSGITRTVFVNEVVVSTDHAASISWLFSA